jgi:hypothetical protein
LADGQQHSHTQITQFGMALGAHRDDQIADHIGSWQHALNGVEF